MSCSQANWASLFSPRRASNATLATNRVSCLFGGLSVLALRAVLVAEPVGEPLGHAGGGPAVPDVGTGGLVVEAIVVRVHHANRALRERNIEADRDVAAPAQVV